MKVLRTAAICLAWILTTSVGDAAEPTPALSLVEASKLAEGAVKDARLPANHYLRSIELIQKRDPATSTPAAPYYRASYKPSVKAPAKLVDPVSQTVTVEVIHIAMDGKVVFKQEEIPRLSIQIK